VRLFDNLLKKKEASENNNSDYEKMLKNIDKIHRDLFEDLEQSIIEHEQLLSRTEQAENGLSDNDYREKHRHLFSRMNTFKNNFKTFKRIIVDYVKGL
jgi:hypothetical protein